MTIIEAKRAGNYLRLYLNVDPTLSILAALQQDGKLLENAILSHRRDAQVELTALASRSGRYDINIFSKKIGSSDEYAFVSSYPFEHQVTLGNALDRYFPATFGQFIEGGVYLDGPLYSPLAAGSTVRFRLRVPGATQVALSVGDDFVFLTQESEWFSGEVSVAMSGEVVVLAAYDASGEFHGLARYDVSQ